MKRTTNCFWADDVFGLKPLYIVFKKKQMLVVIKAFVKGVENPETCWIERSGSILSIQLAFWLISATTGTSECHFSVGYFQQVFIGWNKPKRQLNGQNASRAFDSTRFGIFNTFCDTLYCWQLLRDKTLCRHGSITNNHHWLVLGHLAHGQLTGIFFHVLFHRDF